MTITPQDKIELINNIRQDRGISKEDRDMLMELTQNPNFFETLLKGIGGATLGYLIGKYLKLGKGTKILLSLAGFGIGAILIDKIKKKNDFVKYDKAMEVYQLGKL